MSLLPCPNPWCHPVSTSPPTLFWIGQAAVVECTSCGMQGPSFSPIVHDDDGERVGSQDAELLATTAWNTRPDPVKLGQDHMSLLDILLNVRDAFVSGYKPSDKLLDCIDDAITAHSKVQS